MAGVERLLLDTHALIWAWTGDPRLSEVARVALENPANEVFISPASVWEMRTKSRLGRLAGIPPIPEAFADLIRQSDFRVLDITWRHADSAAAFEATHQDPFDRMLAAQSCLEGLSLVTNDAALRSFPISVIW